MVNNIYSWILSVLFIFGLIVSAAAQNTIEETPALQQFMNYFVSLGKEEPYIDGWRIKLISTTDRRAVESAKWLLERNYPDMIYEMTHEAPYYSIKLGAYESRLVVEPDLIQFKEDFPLAIPFRDRIMKTELFDTND